MILEIIDIIHDYLVKTYYTGLLPLFVAFYSLTKLKSKRNVSFKKERIFYLIATLSLFGIGSLLDMSKVLIAVNAAKIINLWNVLFSIGETVVFCKIFSYLIPGAGIQKSLHKICKIVIGIGLIVFCQQLIDVGHRSTEWTNYFTTAQLYLLVILCVTYFYHIYKSNIDLIFFEAIIVFALFSYCIVSIPYFLLAYYVDYRYSIDMIFYAFHYFLISFLCFTLSLSTPPNAPN